MKISQIYCNSFTAAPSPEAAKKALKTTCERIGKVEQDEFLITNLNNSLVDSMKNCYNSIDAQREIKISGIKKLAVDANVIQMTTFNNNSFRIIPPINLNTEAAEYFILSELGKRSDCYGIPTFLDFIKNFPRIDLVKKGLRINSFELDYVPAAMKLKAANALSKKIKKRVYPHDLFAASSELYYADKKNKIIYSVNYAKTALTDNNFSTCKFIQDEKGNITGYELSKYDIIRGAKVTKKYEEQQSVEKQLPDIVNTKDLQNFALACRFGNCMRTGNSDIVNKYILQQLELRNINDVTVNDLKGVRYRRKDGTRNTIVCYYNPDTGRTLAFDKEGRFLTEIAFEKDEEGQILFSYNIN